MLTIVPYERKDNGPLADKALRVLSLQHTARRGWDAMSNEEVFQTCVKSIRKTNFVATGRLDVQRIDIIRIAKDHPGAMYHPFTFRALIERLASPRTMCSVYPTGMVACMGSKSPAEALLALQKYVHVLNCQGVPCTLINMKIDNVVSSVLAFPVDLHMLQQRWGHVVKFWPKKFPGASLDCSGLPIDPPTNIVMEIFKSGNINITGARTYEEVIRVYKWVHLSILEAIRIREGEAVRASAAGANFDYYDYPRYDGAPGFADDDDGSSDGDSSDDEHDPDHELGGGRSWMNGSDSEDEGERERDHERRRPRKKAGAGAAGASGSRARARTARPARPARARTSRSAGRGEGRDDATGFGDDDNDMTESRMISMLMTAHEQFELMESINRIQETLNM